MIGMLVIGLTATAVETAPSYWRLITSARSVHRYWRDLDAAGSSLSPIGRLVFSLVLANTKAPQAQEQGTARPRRT
jgi:hypothetical protein